MLILHQTGSVKVGEVVRYTLTYTPNLDRILPPPTHLYVKIKNTSAIPLRAAYLHGPYTLYVSCYPSTFNPNTKHKNQKEEGVPEYEPQLKAGGHWIGKLTVPEEIRQDADRSTSHRSDSGKRKSFTWMIEVSSQVLFSSTAAVHFEVLVGRDEKSVHLGFHGVVGSGQGAPGKLEDHQEGRSRNAAHPKGVFSKAVKLVVDDTESLWDKPAFPEWDDGAEEDAPGSVRHGNKRNADVNARRMKKRKPKKVHLVVLTHGLHSNLGADMLYMKESIDAAARQARDDAKKRKEDARAMQDTKVDENEHGSAEKRSNSAPEGPFAVMAGTEKEEEGDADDEEEEVLVRGFSGNAIKTERGIQYLGKRLAKYVLSITYPDQPYLPVKSSISKTITRTLTGQFSSSQEGKPAHKNSSIVKDDKHTNHNLPYKITSISFIGHSLGGLIQTYAIAYIQKHSPDFFDLIKPVNFVAMATPFLGLSNENPMYVKFALDFGLVGRTGQDLGLTWRPPNIARSGWGAMIGGFSNEAQKDQQTPDPGSKPLLRILPTGPAHSALKRFRNRTVYSNVVNDGIVPLRTSCLLFLDYRGLGRVEKARRENGLVGTMVGWGWAEMTGQNASAPRKPLTWNDLFSDSGDETGFTGKKSPDSPDPGSKVPQADAGQEFDFDSRPQREQEQVVNKKPYQDEVYDQEKAMESSSPNLWTGFLALFRPQAGRQSHHHPPKNQKIYRRGQITPITKESKPEEATTRENSSESQNSNPRQGMVRGASLYTNNSENGEVEAPPKTTFFESAGDLLNPPLPPQEFLLDPEARPRTIFHDRVYHPDDIPPPPTKRQRTLMKRSISRESVNSNKAPSETDGISQQSTMEVDSGGMKIEEKIARAYHKDLSWRKVLVRLEPDAHNNMIVRRMFANAYGWPVVKHMCDTHFAYTAAARMKDDEEEAVERAKPAHEAASKTGEEVTGQIDPPKQRDKLHPDEAHRARTWDNANLDKSKPNVNKLPAHFKAREVRTDSEARESRDEITDLVSKISATGQPSDSYSSMNSGKTSLSRLARKDSARWSDRFFEGSEDDSDDDEEYAAVLQKARERGEILTEEETRLADKMSRRSTQSARLSKDSTKTSDQSTTSSSAAPPVKILADSSAPLVAEPAKLDPGVQAETDQAVLDQTHSLEPVRSLTEVGLGKTVEESVLTGPESPTRDRRGSLGVAEQVARAQSKSATSP